MNLSTAIGFVKQAALDAAGLMARSKHRFEIAGRLQGKEWGLSVSSGQGTPYHKKVKKTMAKVLTKSLRDRGVAEMMQAQ